MLWVTRVVLWLHGLCGGDDLMYVVGYTSCVVAVVE